MRSSKSRSRNKSGRNNRSVGNVTNRVFDSSGPEGKVRGTPAQIIEKYNQLARDAQLSNDRVAAENFQQHAEHYTRLLGEAQREQEARREQQEAQQRDRQRDRDNERNAQSQNGQSQSGHSRGGQSQGSQSQGGPSRHNQHDSGSRSREAAATQPTAGTTDLSEAPQPDLMDARAQPFPAETDNGLVETPESKPKRPPRKRSRAAKPDNAPVAHAEATPEATPEAKSEPSPEAPVSSAPDAPEAAE